METPLSPGQIDYLQKENEQLKAENAEIVTDLRKTRQVIIQLLTMLGVVDVDGNFNESVDFGHMFKEIQTMIFMGEKKRTEKFGFLSQLTPLVEKYKNV